MRGLALYYSGPRSDSPSLMSQPPQQYQDLTPPPPAFCGPVKPPKKDPVLEEDRVACEGEGEAGLKALEKRVGF